MRSGIRRKGRSTAFHLDPDHLAQHIPSNQMQRCLEGVRTASHSCPCHRHLAETQQLPPSRMHHHATLQRNCMKAEHTRSKTRPFYVCISISFDKFLHLCDQHDNQDTDYFPQNCFAYITDDMKVTDTFLPHYTQ